MDFRRAGLGLILVHAIVLFTSPDDDAVDQSIDELGSLLRKSTLDAYYGLFWGALIWYLVVGARRSKPGPVRKWVLMQLTRIVCPSSLDDLVGVSKNLDMIFAGLDGIEGLRNMHPGLVDGLRWLGLHKAHILPIPGIEDNATYYLPTTVKILFPPPHAHVLSLFLVLILPNLGFTFRYTTTARHQRIPHRTA